MREKAVADTSVLIALEKLDLTELLCKIYSEVVLPEAVIHEYGTPDFPCFSVRKVKNPLADILFKNLNLGRGESEVIALGSETSMRVLIDDSKARKFAESLGLKVAGTIGILLKAENSGFIPSAYKQAGELKKKGFYISDKLLEEIRKKTIILIT